MSSDPQLQTAIDRILSSVRGQLEGPLRAYADELTRAGAAERARAVEQATEEIRRQALEQVAQVRDAARQQNDELRRSAEAQIGDLRKLLDDIRRNAQQQIDTARKTVETEVAAARGKADAEIEDARRVAQAQVEDVQRAADARLATAGAELEQARRDLASVRQQLQEAEQRASQQAQRGAPRLAEDIGSLDEAASLGDVLDRLAQVSVRHCDRAALFTVRGDRLREWRTIGFGGRAPDERLELTPAEAGIAGVSAAKGRVVTSDEGPIPAFAASARPADAAAFPVTVAATVVAVLYADVAAATTGVHGWSELDVLARYAGRALETITVQQATGVRGLAHASQPVSPAGSAAATTTQPPSRSMP